MIRPTGRIEWGVEYEIDDKHPSMSGGPTEKTQVQTVDSLASARRAVSNRIPMSGRNHRVVFREVSEWQTEEK